MQAHSHGPKSKHVRMLQVVACAKAWEDGTIDWDQAVNFLKKIEKGCAYKAISSHHRDKLQKCWEHFWETGNVDYDPKVGRPAKCPDSLADMGAHALHQGAWRDEVNIDGKTFLKIAGYDSVADMVCDHPEVAKALDEADVTLRQLYNAMVRRDPTLIRHAETFKYEHDATELKARQDTAKEWLDKTDDIWVAARIVLERMVFMDEGGFALSSLKKGTHKVWMGKEDLKCCDVVSLPFVPGLKDCNVHFFVAVSCNRHYQNDNGIVMWEKTTCTTNIRRSVNTLGQTKVDAYEYLVSYTECLIMVLPYMSQCAMQWDPRHTSRFSTCHNPMVLNPAVNTTAR